MKKYFFLFFILSFGIHTNAQSPFQFQHKFYPGVKTIKTKYIINYHSKNPFRKYHNSVRKLDELGRAVENYNYVRRKLYFKSFFYYNEYGHLAQEATISIYKPKAERDTSTLIFENIYDKNGERIAEKRYNRTLLDTKIENVKLLKTATKYGAPSYVRYTFNSKNQIITKHDTILIDGVLTTITIQYEYNEYGDKISEITTCHPDEMKKKRNCLCGWSLVRGYEI